jgi:hypothetical protein
MIGLVYLGKALDRRGFWVAGGELAAAAHPSPQKSTRADPGAG